MSQQVAVEAVAAQGLNASPGAASGEIVLDADTAAARGKAGDDVILVRWETTPDDIHGLVQARAFHEATGLTGIILTKLDSTAKGGIVFAIEHALAVPVRYVGVGEKVGDLLPFDPEAFVAALFA